MDLGLPELLIILLIVLLLFGSTRLPKLSRSVGEAMRELRNGLIGTGSPTEEKKTPPKEEPTVAEEKQSPPKKQQTADQENIEIKV